MWRDLIKIFDIFLLVLFPVSGFCVSAIAPSDTLMYASQFNVNSGWTTPLPLPELNNPDWGINWMVASGGPTTWAFGTDPGDNHYMDINQGSGWQSIAVPDGFGLTIHSFFPANPETGAVSNGWMIEKTSVVYFDGQGFEAPDTTTFSAYHTLLPYSSMGHGWIVALPGIEGAVFFASAFNANGHWDAPVNLPLLSLLKLPNSKNSYAITANNTMLYLLGIQNSVNPAPVLVGVDDNGVVYISSNNFNLPETPDSGMVVAKGQQILVTFFVAQDSVTENVYSYYSADGGKTWGPQVSFVVPENDLANIVYANGRLVIPAETMSKGANLYFMDLNQSQPAWSSYALSSNPGQVVWPLLSPDGNQLCYSNADNNPDAVVFACFNFNTEAWVNVALPQGERLALNCGPTPLGSSCGPVPLGNNNIMAIAIDQNQDVFYGWFYDDQNKQSSQQPLAPIAKDTFSSVSALPYADNPNNIWLIGYPNPVH